jgi:hypothetical protein
MSIEADVQRDAINMLVDMNPTSVMVQRIEYLESKGARTTATSTIGPIDIALFSNVAKGAPRSIQIVTDGVKMDRVEWSALTKADADFESGGNVSDSFHIEGKGKFRVQTVVDIDTYGETTGKLLFLEMLK